MPRSGHNQDWLRALPLLFPILLAAFGVWLASVMQAAAMGPPPEQRTMPPQQMQMRAPQGDRFALIIGNSAYEHTDPLNNPANDARLIAKAATAAGFDVSLKLNLRQKQLRRAVRNFARKLRKAGDGASAMFYFAGHGTQVRGHNYLLPVDAHIEYDGDVAIEAIKLDDVLAQLEAAQSSLNIIIVDACRNNPFKRGYRSSTRGLAPTKAVKGSLLAYSTAPGTVAQDGEGAHSPYAAALGRYMRQPGLGLERLFKKVRIAVDRQTGGQQTPWEESSLFGEFYFVEKKPAAASNGARMRGHPGAGRDTRLAAETAFWNSVSGSKSPAMVQSYLNAFPSGLFAPLAKARLKQLRAEQQQRLAKLTDPRRATRSGTERGLPAPSAPSANCATLRGAFGVNEYCASSVLPGQHGASYNVANLFDNNNDTAWVENRRGDGLGEWVTIKFDKQRLVLGLSLKNGYSKQARIYAKNNRVKSLRLRFSNGQTARIGLRDSDGLQRIALPTPIRAKWVQISIGEVYRGEKFRDTALNELRVDSLPVK